MCSLVLFSPQKWFLLSGAYLFLLLSCKCFLSSLKIKSQFSKWSFISYPFFFLIRSNFCFPFVLCAVGVVCSSAWRVSLLLTSKILRICLWCCVKCDLTWWCKLVVPIFFEEILFPHWMGLIYFLKDHVAICLLVKRFIYIFNVFICVCVCLCKFMCITYM